MAVRVGRSGPLPPCRDERAGVGRLEFRDAGTRSPGDVPSGFPPAGRWPGRGGGEHRNDLEGVPERVVLTPSRLAVWLLRRRSWREGRRRPLSLGLAGPRLRRLSLAGGSQCRQRCRVEPDQQHGRQRGRMEADAALDPTAGREAGAPARGAPLGRPRAAGRLSGVRGCRDHPREHEGPVPARPDLPDDGLSRAHRQRRPRSVHPVALRRGAGGPGQCQRQPQRHRGQDLRRLSRPVRSSTARPVARFVPCGGARGGTWSWWWRPRPNR